MNSAEEKDTPAALSDFKLKKAKAAARPYKIYDSLELYVLVNPNGSKLWRQKYILNGKERLLTHGSYPAVSLRVAREKRDKVRDQLESGADPSLQKRLDKIEAETRARTTLLLVAEEYLQMAYDRELSDATMRKKNLAYQYFVHRSTRPPCERNYLR